MMRSSRHAGVGLTPFHHAADYGRHGGEGHLDTTRDAGGLQVELRFRLGKSQARPTGQHLGGRATVCYPNKETTMPSVDGLWPKNRWKSPPSPTPPPRLAHDDLPTEYPLTEGGGVRIGGPA
jgi:hypothetical protein